MRKTPRRAVRETFSTGTFPGFLKLRQIYENWRVKKCGKRCQKLCGKTREKRFFIVGLVTKTTGYRYAANRACSTRTQHPIGYCYCRTVLRSIFYAASYSRELCGLFMLYYLKSQCNLIVALCNISIGAYM